MSDAPGEETRDAAVTEDASYGAEQTIEHGVEAVSPAGGGTGVFLPLTYRLPSTSRRRNRTRSRGASFRSEPGVPGAEPPASSVASFGSCPSMLGAVEAGVEDLVPTAAAGVFDEEHGSVTLDAVASGVASGSAPVRSMAAGRPQLPPDTALLGFSDPLVRQVPHSSSSSSTAGVPSLTHVMRMASLDSERGYLSSSLPLMPLDVRSVPLPEDVFTPLFIETCSGAAANCDCANCVACRQQVAAAVGSAAAAANLALTSIHHHTCAKAAAAAAAAAAEGAAAGQADATGRGASTPTAVQPSRVEAPPTPAEPPPSPAACHSTEPPRMGAAATLGSSHSGPQQLRPVYHGAGPVPAHPPPRRRHTLPRFLPGAGQARPPLLHSPPPHGSARAGPPGQGPAGMGAGFSPPGVWVFPAPPGYAPGYMYPAYGGMAQGYPMWQLQQPYSQEELPMVPASVAAAGGGSGGASSSMGAAGAGQGVRPSPPAGRPPGAPAHAAARAAAAVSVQPAGPLPFISPGDVRQAAASLEGGPTASYTQADLRGSMGGSLPAASQAASHGMVGGSSSSPGSTGMEPLAQPRRSPFSAGPPRGGGRLQQQQQQQQHTYGLEVGLQSQSASRSGATSMAGAMGASSSGHSVDTSSSADPRVVGTHSGTTTSGGTTPASSQVGQRWWHKLQEEGA